MWVVRVALLRPHSFVVRASLNLCGSLGPTIYIPLFDAALRQAAQRPRWWRSV
jgi:hypothetical protein